MMNLSVTMIVLTASASVALAAPALRTRDVSTAKNYCTTPGLQPRKRPRLAPMSRASSVTLPTRACFTDEVPSEPSLSREEFVRANCFCASLPLLSGQLTEWEVHWDRGSGDGERESQVPHGGRSRPS